MRAAGGYTDLTVSYETGKPEIALEIARERAADLGVPALQIGAHHLGAHARASRRRRSRRGGERYDVRVQVRPEYRDDLVEARSGARARAERRAGPAAQPGVAARRQRAGADRPRQPHARDHRLRQPRRQGRPAPPTRRSCASAASSASTGEYELEAVGPTQRLRETIAAVGFAFVLALIAIYMILAAQFNSFVHPFTIMLSARRSRSSAPSPPSAIAGVPLDLMGQIAFLMLMGVVMKNGILLVDYTNTLRAAAAPSTTPSSRPARPACGRC